MRVQIPRRLRFTGGGSQVCPGVRHPVVSRAAGEAGQRAYQLFNSLLCRGTHHGCGLPMPSTKPDRFLRVPPLLVQHAAKRGPSGAGGKNFSPDGSHSHTVRWAPCSSKPSRLLEVDMYDDSERAKWNRNVRPLRKPQPDEEPPERDTPWYFCPECMLPFHMCECSENEN